jgi:hypothetical protein
MRPFYNTPSLYTLNPDKPVKPEPTGLELLLKLEDEYSEYRHACNNGYCKSSAEIHDKYKAEISAAAAAAKA